jgi:hypothetical protein
VAGFPAFQGGNDLSLLYTKVPQRAPGGFDKTLHRSVPQSAFWTFGSGVADTAGFVDRLLKIDAKQFAFLPVYSSPDDTKGVIRSALAPQGDQLLTVSQLKERAEREKNAPPTRRRGQLGRRSPRDAAAACARCAERRGDASGSVDTVRRAGGRSRLSELHAARAAPDSDWQCPFCKRRLGLVYASMPRWALRSRE